MLRVGCRRIVAAATAAVNGRSRPHIICHRSNERAADVGRGNSKRVRALGCPTSFFRSPPGQHAGLFWLWRRKRWKRGALVGPSVDSSLRAGGVVPLQVSTQNLLRQQLVPEEDTPERRCVCCRQFRPCLFSTKTGNPPCVSNSSSREKGPGSCLPLKTPKLFPFSLDSVGCTCPFQRRFNGHPSRSFPRVLLPSLSLAAQFELKGRP